MSEVNDKVFQIKTLSPFSFSITADTRVLSPYERQGIAEQVKVPKKIAFKTFESSLTHPYALDRNEMDLCDWEKIGRPELLHLVFNALLEF